MSTKTVLITGANSGIGKETARALAQQGATVIMACRDAGRADSARRDILASCPTAALQVMTLDLASFQSIRTFAAEFQQRYDHLDVLINNAGLLPMRKSLTAEGFEMQIGVNHLGHFLLTKLLLPQLRAANQARVINVASMMHHIGKVDFDSFRGEKPYRFMRAYGQSKLANVLFTRVLAKQLQGDGISVFCLHPGPVATNIAGRNVFRRNLYKLLGAFMSPERGARTSIYLASTAGIENLSGSYFDEYCKVKPGSRRSQDMQLAQKLWDVSETLTA